MRSPKGAVTVNVDRGWLRLRWSCQGKAYTMALGYPDSQNNRKMAEGEAEQIYRDIQSKSFDPTLRKYRPEVAMAKCELTASDLFREFTQHKARKIHPRTLQKYYAIANHFVGSKKHQ